MAADTSSDAQADLAAGRWQQARAGFEAAVAEHETANARFGLAMALWWLGESQASVAECTRAFTVYRRGGEMAKAVRCAVWLSITFKANFANNAAAGGWLARADRLLEGLDDPSLHGWASVARAYRMPDLEQAAALTAGAIQAARTAGDVDLELVAMSQLGLIRVGQGDTNAGFAMIDEALAAALGGDRDSLDTVVYACCDMLNACELVRDLERAGQWCQVADAFVLEYGCPFLYAECRTYYGSLLATGGRWEQAERELQTAVSATAGVCPGLHGKALTRLVDLRTRQGRLEEAASLLGQVGQGVEDELETSICRAALLLAQGEARAASAALDWLKPQLRAHPAQLAAALDLLTDVHLRDGAPDDAAQAVGALDELASTLPGLQLQARATAARGRLLLARADWPGAAVCLQDAAGAWSQLGFPLESARARTELARALAPERPEAATQQARQAMATFEALGARIDIDREAAFLRSIGVGARTGPKGVGALTSREREVLTLLAAGLSNPQIAERLHVSRKTASHHVSSILAKLGLRNRAQAAARAATLLGEPPSRHT